MGFRFSVISMVTLMLLFGCTVNVNAPPENTSNSIEQNTTTIIKTFECQNGKVVSNISQCPSCPKSCDDDNLCTLDACSLSTNYTCLHTELDNTTCGENKTCVSGVCKEKPLTVAITNITEQNETSMVQNQEIVYLSNESRQFIKLVNDKRMDIYGGKVVLSEDKRLNFIAKKCGEEMLKNGSADLTVCYNKYGSFNELLSDVGFYWNNFFYASETNLTGSNLASDLFNNLTTSEKQLLTNISIDRSLNDYPISVDYIGNAIVCNSEKCIQTTITAGNKIIERNKYDNYWAYQYNVLPIFDGKFVPQKFTLTVLEPSESYPSWCELYKYKNMSIVKAESNYWWNDYWGDANHGHTYDRKISWTDYYSEKLDEPETIFVYCYSTKDKKIIAGGETIRDRFEVVREFLPDKSNHSEEELDAIIQKREDIKKENVAGKNGSVLELINKIRLEKGLASLNQSKSLDLLAQSCVEMAVHQKDYSYDSCYKRVFGNSSAPVSYTLATRGMFGGWSLSFHEIENIDSAEYQMETIPDVYGEYFFGDVAKGGEYFGSGKACDGDVCASMFLMGSNKGRVEFTNAKKNCGWGELTCSYGFTFMRWIKMGRGTNLDYAFYPNISLEFNSSVPAEYYFYKNKAEGSELWENGLPRSGWDIHMDDKKKNYSYTLQPGVWSVVYAPEIKSFEATENLTMNIRYIPLIKVE